MLPDKVKLKVTATAPAVRGNSVQGATKTSTLETGLVLLTPVFIRVGDYVLVNTTNKHYVGRA